MFVLLAWIVIALRRGEFGRRLQAMKDSPAACTTLGLDLTRTKVQVFALAAAIAGTGGFLMAGWKGTVGKDDFSVLTGALSGLPVLLLAVVGGITVVSGAMIGALLLVAMPQVAADYPSLNNLMILLPGLAGITLARNPDGIASDVRMVIRDARATFIGWRRTHTTPGKHTRPHSVPEVVGLHAPVTAAELRGLETELGFATEGCNGVA